MKLLTIHDANLRPVAFVDNSKQGTLNYYNAQWTRYLETGASSFEFTIAKKALKSDKGRERLYTVLNEKAFVSFVHKNKTYLHTILKVEENEQTIQCSSVSFNLELINEYTNPYAATKAMTFVEYCQAMNLLNFSMLTVGINEVSDKKITEKWDGTETKLARLLSLANKFGAELEFDIDLNDNSTVKQFTVNVYHEADDTHHGVGRLNPTVLYYGKNLKTITRTVDKTGIYNAVRPTGRDEKGNEVTIAGMAAWSVNNDKGEREFYQNGEMLYAPLSAQMYPSAFTSNTMADQWIRKDMTVDSADKEVIRSTAYREMKKHCYPAVSYEAQGDFDVEIGDTVRVMDNGFTPPLLLEMRVVELTIDLTNPSKKKAVFANFKALKNRLSNGINSRLDEMIEAAKPYTVQLSTDNGVFFKDGVGRSTLKPALYKGAQKIEATFEYRKGNTLLGQGGSYTVVASTVDGSLPVTVSALLDGESVATSQVTFINVNEATNIQIGAVNRMKDYKNPATYWQAESFLGRRPYEMYFNNTVEVVQGRTAYKAKVAMGYLSARGNLVQQVSYTSDGVLQKSYAKDDKWTISFPMCTSVAQTDVTVRLQNVTGDIVVDFGTKALTANEWQVVTLTGVVTETITDETIFLVVTPNKSMDLRVSSGEKYYAFDWVQLERGAIATDPHPAPEDNPQYYKQMEAPVSPAKGSTWLSIASAEQSVGGVVIRPNTEYRYNGSLWEETTVSSNNLAVTDGFVDSRMIKEGAVTVDKLNVNSLSAVSANLGSVTSGEITLGTEQESATLSDKWGDYAVSRYAEGLHISPNLIRSSGKPIRPLENATPDFASVVKLSSGQLQFGVMAAPQTMQDLGSDAEDSFEALGTLETTARGISLASGNDLEFEARRGTIHLKTNGWLYLTADTVRFYSAWKNLGSNVRMKLSGSRVTVDFDIRPTQNGDVHVATVDSEYRLWQNGKDKSFLVPDENGVPTLCRVQRDGKIVLVNAKAGVQYATQVSWEI